MVKKIAIILFSSGILAACGGGGGSKGGNTPVSSPPVVATSSSSSLSDTQISSSSSSVTISSSSSAPAVSVLQGQFKDTHIQGVRFTSGGQSGITNASGTFNYEQGQSVTFSIGAITLGTTAGKALVTPIDLIENGSADDVAVQNMVRLLVMLDVDGYVKNGITISPAVQTAANDWAQVDFNSASFSTSLATIKAAAIVADSGVHTILDTTEAKEHLKSTHLCSYAGAYKGAFTGTNAGNVALLVGSLNGNVSGFAYQETTTQLSELKNVTSIKHAQKVTFETGNDSDGSKFTGELSAADTLAGTWAKGSDSGAFTGTRLAGAATSIYRFNASYTGDDSGLFTVELNDANLISGASYSVKSKAEGAVTGNLVGTTFNGKIGTMDIKGKLSLASGGFGGDWSDATKGTSGTFVGSGCQINPAPLSIDGFRVFTPGGAAATIPAPGANPIIMMDGSPVMRVQVNVNQSWAEMSFPINGYEETGSEGKKVDLSGSGSISITYKSNQPISLQLREYAIHGGDHNRVTLPVHKEFDTIVIPLSDFKGGITELNLKNVAKFNFALLSNNPTDGYVELIVKHFKIENFND